MINRDKRCVHVVDNPNIAHVVVAFLEQNGVEAAPMGIELGGILEALPGMSKVPQMRGIEIWVKHEADIGRALVLIEEHAAGLSESRAEQPDGPISVTCEDCGKTSEFPGELAGKTEHCPHCGGYIDVPSGDDDMQDEWWKTDEASADKSE